jgi:hypothetical protein
MVGFVIVKGGSYVGFIEKNKIMMNGYAPSHNQDCPQKVIERILQRGYRSGSGRYQTPGGPLAERLAAKIERSKCCYPGGDSESPFTR